MGFQKEGKLKCQLLTALWVHILKCLQTNTAFNGWWTLLKIKYNEKNNRFINDHIRRSHAGAGWI